MEKVFLRVYNREIEGMIEGGQLDEAVAHCLHILKTFPMHVETYRLLGKSFLEARRYTDAADIFQRVLMAVPDDFVSHVGMSIICDDGGKLDDAIWHMERAFEVQPSNSAIQGELRRLYGRRDGVEPSKIRLSRDALANMYSQGELFNQAIAEIRSVLADDPNRPDLQVMLMRAYYRSGQKVEAAEIAANLLKKYPYCLDSLRVLVDVLPGTARAENTQVYLHRLLLLDPYSSSKTDSIFSSDQVADSNVNLERLDYRPGAMPGSPQPDWESSLGIKLNTDKRPEPAPEGMQIPEISEKPTTNTSEPSELAIDHATNPSQDAVPDWMRSAGWLDSKGEEKNDSVNAGVAPPDESIAKADIPDWLKSMAPTEGTDVENTEPEEPKATLPTGEDGIPDWLKPVVPTVKTEDVKIETQADVDTASENEGKSIALPEAAEEKSMEAQGSDESQPGNGEGIPDWFNSITPAETPGEPTKEPQEPIEPQPAKGVDIPDWLKPLASAEAVGLTLKEPHEPVEPQPAKGVDIPDWLKSMAPTDAIDKLNVDSEPVIEPTPAEATAAASNTLPDWLTGVGAQAAEAKPTAAETLGQPETIGQPIPEQPVPEKPVAQTPVETPISQPDVVGESFQPSGEGKPLNIGDDALGWLESLAAKQGAKPEELLTNPQERSAEMPDWLRQDEEKPIEAAAAPVLEPVRNPPEPVPLEPLDRFASSSTLTPEQPIEEAFPEQEEVKSSESPAEAAAKPAIKSASGEEDTMSWLERLSAEQNESPEVPLVSPEESLEITPEENQQIPEEHPADHVPEESIPAPQKPAIDEDITITSWLSKLDVEEALGKKSIEQPNEEKPAVPVEELPDWLKSLESPIKPVETPKAVEDLPEWLRQPIAPAEPEMTSESEVPAWVDEITPVTGQTVPTKPEEWVPTEVKPDTDLESLPIPEAKPVDEKESTADHEPMSETTPVSESELTAKTEQLSEPVLLSVKTLIHPPTLKQTGMLSPVPVQDKDAELLSNAQTILDQDSLDESMKQYMKLVKKGRLLDEVIHDLREAIYRYPVDVIIWQTLGDAYMRSNRLQDALDAYTKAEELLR